MKIILELFGASRDFSDKDFLQFEIKKEIEVKDLKKEIISYLDTNFKATLKACSLELRSLFSGINSSTLILLN